MKRITIKTFMFLFMMLTLLFQFNVNKISAEEKEVVSYYQAIVSDSNDPSTFSGFTAVSQYFYKNSGQIGQLEDDGDEAKAALSARETGFYDLSEEGICENVFKSGTASTYCKDKNIKPAIVKLTITNHGNVQVYVGSNASVTNLRFYYVIANQSNQAQLFCSSSGEICQRAKIIGEAGNMSSWKNLDRSGGKMSYSDVNLEENFDVKIHASSGKTYYNFNVVTQMKPEYAELARKYGVYVVTAMSVRYVKDNTEYNYYLNRFIQDKEFSNVENLNQNEVTNVNVCAKENIQSETGCTNYPNSVSKAAVLVRPAAEADVRNNKAYNDILDYLDRIIIPAAKILIILSFLIVGTSSIITIVKSSDEPDVRHGAIKKLITISVSAVVIYVILLFWKPIVEAVAGWFG